MPVFPPSAAYRYTDDKAPRVGGGPFPIPGGAYAFILTEAPGA